MEPQMAQIGADKKIEVGRVYAAKRPRVVFLGPLGSDKVFNDRQVTWSNGAAVQYDSPTVAMGRALPTISMEKFVAWAGEDVTDKCPASGEWRPAP